MEGNRKVADAAVVRVCVYARYSSDMQQPVSIERQVQTCQQYAARQGWGMVRAEAIYVDEKKSGSVTAQRTEYQRLMAEIAASPNGRPPYDILLIEDLSRLMRDMIETAKLVKAAPIWGLRIVGVSDGVDTARRGTKLLTYIKGAMNEAFLDDLRLKVHGGLAQRFLAGKHAGGFIYGYKTEVIPDPTGAIGPFGVPKILGHQIIVDPETAPIVKRIFADTAKGLTRGEIARALTCEGVPKPSATYKATTPAAQAGQRSEWRADTVARILENPKYIGLWRWNETENLGKTDRGRMATRRRPPDEVLEQKRPHLALVDQATWDRVQACLAARGRGVLQGPDGRLCGREKGCPGPTDRANPWQGLLWCGVCGGPIMVVSSPKGEVRRLGCNRRRWNKAACANGGTLRLDRLNEALKAALSGYFSDARLAERQMRRFLDATNAATQQLRAVGAKAERERDRRLANIEQIKKVILSGGAGPTTAAMLKEEEAQLAEAEAKLRQGEARRTMRPLMKPPEEIIRSLRVEGFYERRAAYRALVARVGLRSVRQGNQWTEKWIGQIEPVPTAGISGLPEVVMGRDEFYFNRGERRTARGRSPGSSATAPWSFPP